MNPKLREQVNAVFETIKRLEESDQRENNDTSNERQGQKQAHHFNIIGPSCRRDSHRKQ